MTGGILQLVAVGKEDEIISMNPNITLFKTVYRRHTNFDKAEHILSFNNNLTFGTSATCIIRKLADLVSAMTLVVELPDIDISYKPLTNVQLAIMLKEYEITWTYDLADANKLITQNEFEQVVGIITYISGRLTRLSNGMINDKIDELTKTIEKDDAFIKTIHLVTDKYIKDNNKNLTDYLDDLMLELLSTNRNLFISDEEYTNKFDYYNQYYYLHSYKNDIKQLNPQSVAWQDGTGDMVKIISFYDPTNGLPDPHVEDRYICSRSERGWIENKIYRYYDAGSIGENNWTPFDLQLGYGAHIQHGYTGMTANLLSECVGFNKLSNGVYDSIIDGFPQNPSVGDNYISATNNIAEYNWVKNNIYTWNGVTWHETIPIIGNALFINGMGNHYQEFYQKLLYFNGSEWIIFSPEITIIYDGSHTRKSVISFYDPKNGLPDVSIFGSVGSTYISTGNAYGWIEHNMYVWDGWEWIEKVPTENYGVYIESGDMYSNSMFFFNGAKWEVLSLQLPLYDYTKFRKLVSSILQNIIFTDTNIELLYAVENCNTTLLPSTAILPTRIFFNNIIENEIGTIDTNSVIYKSVYNTFFDDSIAGSMDHVLSVQNELKSKIRTEIDEIINPNIRMMTTIYNRLQFVDASNPDYYRFTYYKYFPYNGSYDKSQKIVNCPREYYNTSNTLMDRYASYIIPIATDTEYCEYIRNNVLTLTGNKSSGSDGTLYEQFMDERVITMFDNFFINTTTRYATALNEIIQDPYEIAGNRKMYNLPSCFNIIPQIKENLKTDLLYYSITLTYTLGEKGIIWSGLLSEIINYINNSIPSLEPTLFPKSLWNDTDGFLSKMTPSVSSLDRMVTFIFRYYVLYDVYKLLPIECTYVPPFTINSKNPIEYVILTFTENLIQYVINKNNYIDASAKLSEIEMNSINVKLRHIGNAYISDGLCDYETFDVHGTNIQESVIPELFDPIMTPFETYHVPYDGITSLTCYLLNSMKTQYNTHYQIITEQQVYDNLGNPFMNANAQFITNTDFYVYGNQMYLNGYKLIGTMIDVYLNDMTMYNKYGNVLKIKNLFLDKQQNMFSYPIEMYVRMHEAIYNNQSIYINTSESNYDDTYENVLVLLDNKMLPLLEYLNDTNNIYMGAMDLLITTPENRLIDLRTNPYSAITDIERYNWYNTIIIQNIIDKETDFMPSTVGLIEYFLLTINSETNPFASTMQLYNWYEGIERNAILYEIEKMGKLFGLPYYRSNPVDTKAITPQSLYNDIGNINSKYNGFSNMTFYIHYLMDHIIILSQLGSIIKLFKGTIEATRDELINYYELEKSKSTDIINKIGQYTRTSIRGSIRYSQLEDIIRNIYNKKAVNFAWVKEIGHYIIETIQLMVDDTVIDQLTGEYMHIVAYTEGTMNQKRGYFKMIGNVPELTEYNDIPKRKYKLFIPLFFTFSKFYCCALPLVCMKFADISIRVKLRSFNDVAYYAPLTQFNKTPKLKCSVIADYIYLDNEERMRVAPMKHEQLIEIVDYNGGVSVNLNESNTATIRLSFSGTSKELFIVCQMDENIDGTLPNGEKQWNNYLVNMKKMITMMDGSTIIQQSNINPIEKLQINFNGRERETSKDIEYYTCAQRIAHHNVCSYDGINVYSFALSPQLLQPSGCANLGKIGYVDLIIKFRDDVVATIGKNKKMLRVGVYNKSINILRIMSGLAGLAFYD